MEAQPDAADHDHVFAKDSRRFGWSCRVPGCGVFKCAEDFDRVLVVGGGSRES